MARTLLLLFFTLLFAACRPADKGIEPEELAVADVLGAGSVEGYARAEGARSFRFPEDHGPHPAYRTEWWYFTGNLAGTDGRRFGYQLTFFRVALAPEMPDRSSAWGARQVYMAHFALTDAAAGRFVHAERFSRAALGLAGIETQPFRLWIEDWSAAGERDFLPLRLKAVRGEIAIDLQLHSAKPPVLQGDRGFSRKSGEPGNASYYYSLTRMPTAGEIRVGQERYQVEGLSWLDREWSTSALGPEQAGWDWFSLQFDDGRELMFYRLREKDGGASPWSAGTLVEKDGTVRRLGADDVQLRIEREWRSPETGAAYPVAWQLAVPGAGLDLEIEPLLDGQELRTTVRYWEGAVVVRGEAADQPLQGRGYVELTGY